MDKNMPQNQNRQISTRPPFSRSNLNKPENQSSVVHNNDVELNENKKSKKVSKLNPQAKLVMISMFSAICFAGAIALIVLMFIL